ncbi:hypothetical protein JCM33374_g621 [Metschnikowia sp. JCM 33374]|nr:hypothetical protein JCM33374_g621 [Metschnikowia sp. JCM 33374]
MAVLAVSICTHGGKALVSRQFRDLTKDRITELLAKFPSLLSNSGSQNTTVEDESVRFVYQPLEEYYVVLLTNKSSNILQDIETLHLFVSVVSNMLHSVDEKEIFNNAFEMLSAFDEIVTLGYPEKLTMSQVQSFLEMDSHEEKIQEIIERNKEMEATEERRRRAKDIQRKELARRNMESVQPTGFGAPNASMSSQEAFGYNTSPSSGPSYGNTAHVQSETPEPVYNAPRAVAGKGLQLGKKATKQHATEQRQPLLTTRAPLAATGAGAHANANEQPQAHFSTQKAPTTQPEAVPSSTSASPAQVQGGAQKALNNGILITLNEKITAELNREGGITSSEVKGDLNLRINNAQLARAKILLSVGTQHGIQYKTHPNVDRGLFSSSSSIGLKDKNKPFPSNDQSLGVLRWKAVAKDEDTSLVPLLFTAWVSLNDGVADVNLEYELTQDFLDLHPNQVSFDDVKIVIPIASDDVILKEDSTGHVSYDVTDEGIVFTLAQIDLSEPTGTFEFSIPVESEDSLFPMQVAFNVSHTSGLTEADGSFGKVSVIDVVSNDDDERSLPFDLHSNLISESYYVN